MPPKQEISENLREMIFMKHVDGLSYRKIAGTYQLIIL